MYAKSMRPSAKREVQKERSAKRATRMYPPSGQIFSFSFKYIFLEFSIEFMNIMMMSLTNELGTHGLVFEAWRSVVKIRAAIRCMYRA